MRTGRPRPRRSTVVTTVPSGATAGWLPSPPDRELGAPGDRDALEVLVRVEVELLLGPRRVRTRPPDSRRFAGVGLGVSPAELAVGGEGKHAESVVGHRVDVAVRSDVGPQEDERPRILDEPPLEGAIGVHRRDSRLVTGVDGAVGADRQALGPRSVEDPFEAAGLGQGVQMPTHVDRIDRPVWTGGRTRDRVHGVHLEPPADPPHGPSSLDLHGNRVARPAGGHDLDGRQAQGRRLRHIGRDRCIAPHGGRSCESCHQDVARAGGCTESHSRDDEPVASGGGGLGYLRDRRPSCRHSLRGGWRGRGDYQPRDEKKQEPSHKPPCSVVLPNGGGPVEPGRRPNGPLS